MSLRTIFIAPVPPPGKTDVMMKGTYAQELFVKLVAAIILGMVISFGLEILGVWALFSAVPHRVWVFAPLFPLVCLISGCVVAFVARKKVLFAAAVALAPWSICQVIGASKFTCLISEKLMLVGIVSFCYASGLASAWFVGIRMARLNDLRRSLPAATGGDS